MFKLSPTIYLSYVVPMDNLQLTAHKLDLSQILGFVASLRCVNTK